MKWDEEGLETVKERRKKEKAGQDTEKAKRNSKSKSDKESTRSSKENRRTSDGRKRTPLTAGISLGLWNAFNIYFCIST